MALTVGIGTQGKRTCKCLTMVFALEQSKHDTQVFTKVFALEHKYTRLKFLTRVSVFN